MSDQFRMIAPDLAGFGQSKSDKPFTIPSLADDVHALLQSIDALPCVLGGLSMGGYVAFVFLTRCPKDLGGLMLIDTKCEGDSSEAKQGRMKMIETVRTAGVKAVADQMMPKMLMAKTLQSGAAVVGKVRAIMESCPALTIEHACLAMCDREDYCDELPSISVPTLIVAGEHDALTTPEMARGMQRNIPHARVEIIPDSAHLTPMENAGAVTAAMRSFLGQFNP